MRIGRVMGYSRERNGLGMDEERGVHWITCSLGAVLVPPGAWQVLEGG